MLWGQGRQSSRDVERSRMLGSLDTAGAARFPGRKPKAVEVHGDNDVMFRRFAAEIFIISTRFSLL